MIGWLAGSLLDIFALAVMFAPPLGVLAIFDRRERRRRDYAMRRGAPAPRPQPWETWPVQLLLAFLAFMISGAVALRMLHLH